MSSFEASLLGLVQGLTEFLPISSSGHLILIPYFFHFEDPGLAYDVSLHMGSLAAILIFFWRDWLEIIAQFFRIRPETAGMNWKLLIVGTIPGVIAGLALEKAAEESFRNPLLIPATLSAFGLLLFYFDRVGRKSRDMAATTMRDALVVGCAQALAIVPGVSRSGITITAGLMLGLTRSTAVRFSFLLSAPIIGGAGVLKAKHILHALMAGGAQMNAVLIGFGSSLVASLLAIGLLSYIVKSRTFNVFVAYRLVLALVIVVVVIFR